jgi:hypothetical protein
MKTADWDSPEIRAIGARYAAEAYELGSDLHTRGADASQLLLSYRDQDMTRPRTIELPTMMVDALMALCLYLQRPPEPPLDESVKALMQRIRET